MKFLTPIFIFATGLLILGCPTKEEVTPIDKPIVVEQPKVEEPVVKAPLAWGKSHADWDKFLYDAIEIAPSYDKVPNICLRLNQKDCLAQLISKMAQYESGYKPSSLYRECNKSECKYSGGCQYHAEYGYCMKSGNTVDGGIVISRGLMQMSYSSARNYGCKFLTKPEDLHDPKMNLECAVIIANKWVIQDGVFFDSKVVDGATKHYGMARYWSVVRSSSKSKPKIVEYMKGF